MRFQTGSLFVSLWFIGILSTPCEAALAQTADGELSQLRYAQELIAASQDQKTYHQAARILRRLSGSQDAKIRHDAAVCQAANNLRHGLLANTRQTYLDLLAQNPMDADALALQAEYERLPLHCLSSYYHSQSDEKRNNKQAAGITYDSYWGHNFYLSRDYSQHHLTANGHSASYLASVSELKRQFAWGSISGAISSYFKANAKSGGRLALTYEPADSSELLLEAGRRLHEHAGTVRSGIRETYQGLTFKHDLTAKTTFVLGAESAELTDQNAYREYRAKLIQRLQKRHNYQDALQLTGSSRHYDHEQISYDAPRRRLEYAAGFSRQWNSARKSARFTWQTLLGRQRDNEERPSFTPAVHLEYRRDFRHHQNLTIDSTYKRYLHQPADSHRRHESCSLGIRYAWCW